MARENVTETRKSARLQSKLSQYMKTKKNVSNINQISKKSSSSSINFSPIKTEKIEKNKEKIIDTINDTTLAAQDTTTLQNKSTANNNVNGQKRFDPSTFKPLKATKIPLTKNGHNEITDKESPSESELILNQEKINHKSSTINESHLINDSFSHQKFTSTFTSTSAADSFPLTAISRPDHQKSKEANSIKIKDSNNIFTIKEVAVDTKKTIASDSIAFSQSPHNVVAINTPIIPSEPLKKRDNSDNNSPPLPISKDYIDSLIAELPQIPAYEKFVHLGSVSSIKFTIPDHLQMLEKLLYALDTICTFSIGRGHQSVIFHKILKSMENIVCRSIKIDHVKQILVLLPHAYNLNERIIIWLGKKTKSWEISIPMTGGNDDNSKSLGPENNNVLGSNFNSSLGSFNSDSHHDGFNIGEGNLSQEQLLDRRERLHRSIIDYIKPFHQSFLKSSGIVLLSGDSVLRSWHPKFDIESVPEISLFSSGNDDNAIQGKGIEQIKENNQEQEKNVNGNEIEHTERSGKKVIASDERQDPKRLSVLERIKEKEMRNDVARMTGSTSEKERILQNQKELADFAESISFLFLSLNKGSLPFKEVYSKLSGKSIISSDEMEQKITKLSKTCPEWISIEVIGLSKFVRIQRSFPIASVKTRIHAHANETVNIK